MFGGILIVVAFILIAMLWNEGMWGNALTFVNLTFASLISLNFFEPVADLIDDRLPSFTYVADFLSIWFLFALTMLVLRTVTDQISKHNVRFKLPIEQAGRVIFAAAAAGVFVCFLTTAMHTAPLARTAFRGSFQSKHASRDFFGQLAPDQILLGFMAGRSQGALSGSQGFDENKEFIIKYAARRHSLEKYNGEEGTIRVKK